MNTPDRSADAVAEDILAFMAGPDIVHHLDALRQRLPPGAQILVAGGALRNRITAFIHGRAPATRDIDCFVAARGRPFDLARRLADEPAERTDLGGIRWRPATSAYAWDVSRLSDFIIFRRYSLRPSLQNLLAHIDFNVNAAVVNTYDRSFHERHCISAVRQRRIDFNTRKVFDRTLLTYRILVIGGKTGFVFSERVFGYLRNAVGLDTLRRVKGLAAAKQGGGIGVDKLMAVYNAVMTSGDYAAYCCRMRDRRDGNAPDGADRA